MSNAVPQANTRTNTLAAIALVLGFVYPLLAIPVGHVARRQIVRTGERGDGLALAGLVLGYPRAHRGSECRHRLRRVRHARAEGPRRCPPSHDPEGAQPRATTGRPGRHLPVVTSTYLQSPPNLCETSKLAHPVITTIDSCRNFTAGHSKGHYRDTLNRWPSYFGAPPATPPVCRPTWRNPDATRGRSDFLSWSS